jgi:hypothetical protein
MNHEKGARALNVGTRAIIAATAAETTNTRTAWRLIPRSYQYGEESYAR